MPKTPRITSEISPSVAQALTPATIGGMRLLFPRQAFSSSDSLLRAEALSPFSPSLRRRRPPPPPRGAPGVSPPPRRCGAGGHRLPAVGAPERVDRAPRAALVGENL